VPLRVAPGANNLPRTEHSFPCHTMHQPIRDRRCQGSISTREGGDGGAPAEGFALPEGVALAALGEIEGVRCSVPR
jgi:hypothetical protein